MSRPGDPVLNRRHVLEAGMVRCRQLVRAYGITSTEVLECVLRWGKVLDDVSRETEQAT